MRALRWVWSGVLAFDRIGTRIPQLIQIDLPPPDPDVRILVLHSYP